MQEYTVGFLLSQNLRQVLLVHKLAPEWQKGKINGIGGKIEQDELPIKCMEREMMEETGILIPSDKWQEIGEVNGEDWRVYFFVAVYDKPTFRAKVVEKEKIQWYKIASLPKNVIENLNWIVPIALDKLKGNNRDRFKVEY